MEQDAMLETAGRAARAAGRELAAASSLPIEVDREEPGDIKLAMDRRAEEIIVRTILERFPDHRILSEECGAAGGEGEVEWVIDPLDGTTNYSRHIPGWCTCIAARRSGETLVGVVYDPLREDLFAARRGGGAFRNGRLLRVSGRGSIRGSIVAYGIYHRQSQSVEAWLKRAPLLTRRARSTRNLGSAGLHIAYVAAGLFDVFVEYGVFPWDVAAGALLVREAGGEVTEWPAADGAIDIIAGSPGVREELTATGLWPWPEGAGGT